MLLAQAKRSIVLADADKWGVVGLTTFAELSDLDVLVSDDALPKSAREAMREAGVEVLIAQA